MFVGAIYYFNQPAGLTQTELENEIFGYRTDAHEAYEEANKLIALEDSLLDDGEEEGHEAFTSAEKAEMLRETNIYRCMHGAGPLRWSNKLY